MGGKKVWVHRNLTQPEKHERWYSALRTRVIVLLGARCECCGETHHEFLAIDHVEGGGFQERKKMNAVQMLKQIEGMNVMERQRKYRLLCHNCNASLGFYGYCAHEMEGVDW